MDKKRIIFEVVCLDRQLVVDVNIDDTSRVNKILETRYDSWNSHPDDVDSSCCEEYMLEGLDDENIAYKEVKYVFIEGRRDGYSPEQCGETMTVRNLIEKLQEYDGDALVYLNNDNNYTFGSIDDDSFKVE